MEEPFVLHTEKINTINTIGILSDIHLPYHNEEYLYRACEGTKGCDVIVIDGDLFDFPALSKFALNPTLNIQTLDKQIQQGYNFLSELRKENKNAKIYFVCGNHDFRIQSYIIRGTQNVDPYIRERMYNSVDLEIDLDLKGLEIEFIGSLPSSPRWTDTYINIDGILIGHFDVVSNPMIPAGQTVRKIIQKYGRFNIVQAHIHRAATIWDSDMEGNKIFGVENPCLCQPAFYRKICNWQYGYTLVKKIDGEWRPNVIVF